MEGEIRKIVLPNSGRRRIAEVFGTTLQNVSYALRYTHKEDKARRMRKMALELGGIIVLEIAEHDAMIMDSKTGVWRQTLENGIRMAIHIREQIVRVYDGSELINTYEGIGLNDIEYIQEVEGRRPKSSAGLYSR
ncbi:MAG: hypothetical protein Q4A64_08710 [Porphyromonadaceae bacterium]|nr:hypothetical protein [Porphyromonadaceae bacterium]